VRKYINLEPSLNSLQFMVLAGTKGLIRNLIVKPLFKGLNIDVALAKVLEATF
jgi:hypothetical protein